MKNTGQHPWSPAGWGRTGLLRSLPWTLPQPEDKEHKRGSTEQARIIAKGEGPCTINPAGRGRAFLLEKGQGPTTTT